MAYVSLEHWDAVEIFCRILVRFKTKLKLEQFQDNEFLMEQLKEYSEGKTYKDVSGKIFGYKTNDNNEVVSKRPKAFYELCRQIRYGIPVVLSKNEYLGFMKYINLPLNNFPYRTAGGWEPSDTQRKLEGSKWLLYYLHQDGRNINEPINKHVYKVGIATAVLELKPFAKAEIKGFKPSECYEGKFRTYGKEEKFILLSMRLKELRTKDLNMLVYIGNETVELALGQYHNLSLSIYSGTVMLEPLTEKEGKEETAHFYTGDEIKKLPKYVQVYFSDKSKNILRVPCVVTSISDFDKWQGSLKANNNKPIAG